ncbi:MAG: hypothetical protein ORN98_02845 [Alphaproteobacteria bacterium]|nr:hypothetical protein [Alphaproteobacteria bacterium]
MSLKMRHSPNPRLMTLVGDRHKPPRSFNALKAHANPNAAARSLR